jgi:hypothetical protein
VRPVARTESMSAQPSGLRLCLRLPVLPSPRPRQVEEELPDGLRVHGLERIQPFAWPAVTYAHQPPPAARGEPSGRP